MEKDYKSAAAVIVLALFCAAWLHISFDACSAVKEKLTELNVAAYHIEELAGAEEQAEVPEAEGKAELFRTDIVYNGKFMVKDSRIALLYEGKLYSVFLEEAHSVNTDSEKALALIDGTVSVKITENPPTVSDETCTVTDKSGQMFVVGKKTVGDGVCVLVRYPTTEDRREEDTKKTVRLMNGVCAEGAPPEIYLEENRLYNILGIAMEKGALHLRTDRDELLLFPFDGDYEGAGFEETTLGDVTLLASDIRDEETKYRPFLVITKNRTYELLARSKEEAEALFSGR